MSNETKDIIIAEIFYGCFLIIWIVIWLVVCGDRLSAAAWVWIPFGFGIAYLLFAAAHAYFSPLVYEKADKERKILRWITDYLIALVLAITVIMLVGVQLGNSSVEVIRFNPDLRSFYRFEFLALGSMLLFVFPAYWFSDKRMSWFRGVRHLKTASYIIAIFFCLAGVVELATYLLTN